MPEGAAAGTTQNVPKKTLVYVGVTDAMEIAETGQLARFGEPVDVIDRARRVRHVVDDHGSFQDVDYPGLATRLLQSPNWIEAPEKAKPGVSFDAQPRAAKGPIEKAAEEARRLELLGTNAERRLVEAGVEGDVDEIVVGAPGFAQPAPAEPTVVPAGEANATVVQGEPPVNVLTQPGEQVQTGPVEGEKVQEPESDQGDDEKAKSK